LLPADFSNFLNTVRRKLVFGMAVLALALLLASVVLLGEYRKRSSSLRLKNGTLVKLEAITYGTNHVVSHGTLFQRLLRFLPKDKTPKRLLGELIQRKLNTPTNSIVVWVYMSGPDSEFRAGITDTNGFGAFQSGLESLSILTQDTGSSLNPIVLKEWPRTAPKIAITFFEDLRREAKPIGHLNFKNPSKASATPFSAEPLPARQKNGNLELALTALEVLPNGNTFETRVGRRWACRARFQVQEGGIRNRDWVIHMMWLTDSGGNHRRANGVREWKGESFEIFSDPLWLDNPVWKVEADLIRAANFRTEETVTFSNVPMPSLEMEDAVFQTNLFGLGVTLRSMKEAKSGHSMGAPGFAVEVNAPGDDWVPRIVGISDEQGKGLGVGPHGYGPGYSVMRFSAGTGKSLKVTVTLQRRRKFAFFVRATLITNVFN
jgi:hypothetical protein